jgi:hypothetical protein
MLHEYSILDKYSTASTTAGSSQEGYEQAIQKIIKANREEGSEVRYEEDSCQLAMISRQAGSNVWSFYLLGSQSCVKNQERNMETEVGK